ncbi:MAG: hypothetical protein CVV42_04885 [Candidatus Riflebacteria bacterium HGW-Riflebacteria-2]|jgi:RnfABCDGE-type electron transport complex G subunit|nr:MAG: hypothetical protein CVV42_04885 [Candidatus Riflebacteria bacterium HGW-Riflebacteria-2]
MNARSPAFMVEIRFMLILATLCAVLLLLTRAGIGSRADQSLTAIRAAGEICGIDLPQDSAEAVKVFDRHFVLRSRGRFQFWQSSNKTGLWLCQARGAGMWAEITLLFAYDSTHRRIVGLRVLEQNETAGLGDRIGEEDFYGQFDELEAANGVEMKAIRIHGNQFDAVSGATITSRAVETLLNRALRHLAVIPVEVAGGSEVRP